MKHVHCETCGDLQPRGWSPGELCRTCGGPVRVELACAWCCRFVPDARFCRACGFEMAPAALFGVARMLKDSGIDKLSLAGRTRDLPADHAEHLLSVYQQDQALLDNRVEEMRMVEGFLVRKHRARELELAWLPRLPLGDADRELLGAGPAGPFEHRPERLGEVLESSPLPETREAAQLAELADAGSWAQDEADAYDAAAEVLGELDRPPAGAGATFLVERLAALSAWPLLSEVQNHARLEAGAGSPRAGGLRWRLPGGLDAVLSEWLPAVWDHLTPREREAAGPLLALAPPLPDPLAGQVAAAADDAAGSSDPDRAWAAALARLDPGPLRKAIEGVRAGDEPGLRARVAARALAAGQHPAAAAAYAHPNAVIRERAVRGGLERFGASPAAATLDGFLEVLGREGRPNEPAPAKQDAYDMDRLLRESGRAEARLRQLLQGSLDTEQQRDALLAQLPGLADPGEALSFLMRAWPLDKEVLLGLDELLSERPEWDLGPLWVERILRAVASEDRGVGDNAGRLLQRVLTRHGRVNAWRVLHEVTPAVLRGEPPCPAAPKERNDALRHAVVISTHTPGRDAAPRGFSFSLDCLGGLMPDPEAALTELLGSLPDRVAANPRWFTDVCWTSMEEDWTEALLSLPAPGRGVLPVASRLADQVYASVASAVGEPWFRGALTPAQRVLHRLWPLLPPGQQRRLLDRSQELPEHPGGGHPLPRLNQIGVTGDRN